MFMKTFKKSISLLVVFVFIMSLIPAVGMAEGALTPQELTHKEYANTRDGKTSNTYFSEVYASTTVRPTYKFRVRGTTLGDGNTYKAYVKYDFTGMEKQILSADSAAFVMTATLDSASATNKFKMSVLPGGNEHWTPDDLSAKYARELGIDTQETLFTTTFDAGTSALAINYESADFLSAIKQALRNDPANSIVVLRFDGNSGDVRTKTTPIMNIKFGYNEANLPTDAEYAESIKSTLTWDNLSEERINFVTSDLTLPKNVLGTNVIWTSTNEDAISTSDGTVVVNPNANTAVTLSATVKYGEATTEPVIFNVKIPSSFISHDDIYDGRDDLPLGGTKVDEPTYQKITKEANGIGGKAADDTYYKVCDAAGDPRLDLPRDNATGIEDILEFSFYLKEGARISIDSGLYIEDAKLADGYSSETYTDYAGQFYLSEDGFYRREVLLADLEANKWYNVAIVAPHGIAGTEVYSDGTFIGYEECDSEYHIYINGKYITSTDSKLAATSGYRHIRISGNCADENSETYYYLDNVRVYNAPYVVAENAEAAITMTESTVNFYNNTITVIGTDTTVADIKADIGESFSYTVKVLDEDGNALSDSDVVTEGCTVVVIASNGTNLDRTYSYYDIVVVDGDIVFDAPYIDLDKTTGAAQAVFNVFNYSGSNETYNVYFAVYNSDNSIREVYPRTVVAENGKATGVTFEEVLAKKETAKLFIWKGLVPEMVNVTVTR